MSTGDQKNMQLEGLLAPLGEKLNRSHSSINISLEQMLAYIDKIYKPNGQAGGAAPDTIPAEIKLLLQTFREMAERFYKQYELSLLEEIEKQQNIPGQVDSVVSQLESELNQTNDAVKRKAIQTAEDILKNSVAPASDEHAELTKNFSTHMQAALDKLKDEWQRVYGLVTGSQSLNKDKDLFRALDVVVDAAAYSAGVNAGRVMIVPGSSFALYFFAYLENFAVLTVPIYSIRAPWEWSVFWHELAGYQVRQLEKEAAIKTIRGNLIEFHKRYKALDQAARDVLLNKVTRNNVYTYGNTPQQNDQSVANDLNKRKNQFSLEYLKSVFDSEELLLKDLGGMTFQFEQILADLYIPKNNRMQVYEEIKKTGWCVDWIKELFEDAWSLLAIREPFLDYFEDVLDRHSVSDGRHPDPSIRLSVAREFLMLLDPGITLENRPGPLEKLAAKQILSLISLLIAASYQFEREDDDVFNLRQRFRNSLPELVGTLIGKSIRRWSNEFIQTVDPGRKLESDAEDVIERLSNQELADFISNLVSPESNMDDSMLPCYEKLLEGKGFRELLDLPFFEKDFLNSNKITNVKLGFGVKARSPFISVAETVNFILPSNLLIPGAGGDISFDIDGLTYHTTKLNWNQAFVLHSEYLLQ